MSEHKIKYMTTCGTHIERVEVEGETEKFYVLPGGRRHQKTSGWHAYFDSWKDAKQSIVARMKERIDRARQRLVEAEEDLKDAEAITEKRGQS